MNDRPYRVTIYDFGNEIYCRSYPTFAEAAADAKAVKDRLVKNSDYIDARVSNSDCEDYDSDGLSEDERDVADEMGVR